MTFVIDNSIAISWCIEAERTQSSQQILHMLQTTYAIVPQLWPIEALNGLLMAERRGRMDRPTRHRLQTFLRQLPIRIDDATDSHIWGSTSQLAEQHRLTAYDATYLELAIRLALPLATLDRQLAAAARTSGVVVLPG